MKDVRKRVKAFLKKVWSGSYDECWRLKKIELQEKCDDVNRIAWDKVYPSREKMLDQYCPIQKSGCTTHCIHYNQGGVYEAKVVKGGYGSDPWRKSICSLVQPHCKLWGECEKNFTKDVYPKNKEE